jgi:CheY-like chemotaxis protein
MPKVTGFKFLAALRQIPKMQDTPVALLTTSGYASDVETARTTDVCSYLVKPGSYQELQLRIDGLVKQTLKGSWSS